MSSCLEPPQKHCHRVRMYAGGRKPGQQSSVVKFRRDFELLHQGVDQQAVWNRIMEFYATTFDNVHDVMRHNDCIDGMSARLAGIETYLVTNCMIGDAAP